MVDNSSSSHQLKQLACDSPSIGANLAGRSSSCYSEILYVRGITRHDRCKVCLVVQQLKLRQRPSPASPPCSTESEWSGKRQWVGRRSSRRCQCDSQSADLTTAAALIRVADCWACTDWVVVFVEVIVPRAELWLRHAPSIDVPRPCHSHSPCQPPVIAGRPSDGAPAEEDHNHREHRELMTRWSGLGG